jgi:hypothetical protein
MHPATRYDNARGRGSARVGAPDSGAMHLCRPTARARLVSRCWRRNHEARYMYGLGESLLHRGQVFSLLLIRADSGHRCEVLQCTAMDRTARVGHRRLSPPERSVLVGLAEPLLHRAPLAGSAQSEEGWTLQVPHQGGDKPGGRKLRKWHSGPPKFFRDRSAKFNVRRGQQGGHSESASPPRNSKTVCTTGQPGCQWATGYHLSLGMNHTCILVSPPWKRARGCALPTRRCNQRSGAYRVALRAESPSSDTAGTRAGPVNKHC